MSFATNRGAPRAKPVLGVRRQLTQSFARPVSHPRCRVVRPRALHTYTGRKDNFNFLAARAAAMAAAQDRPQVTYITPAELAQALQDDKRKDQYTVIDVRDDDFEDDPDTTGEPVYLNVYDLMIMNYTINKVGLGIYHSGVEVYNREYSYAGHYHTENTGLKESIPRDTSWLHDAIWRERVYIGKTHLTKDEVRQEFEKLKPIYLGPSYNVLDRNCNHYTEHFIEILTGKKLPDYVNRIMRVAQKVRPCLPGMFRQDLRDQVAPPEFDSHKVHVPQPKAIPSDEAAAAAAART